MLSLSSTASNLGPRFCRTCGRQAEDRPEQTLCDRCGETLELQGYCDICESRVRLSVGMMCPKHDVVLVSDEPTSATRSLADRPISWVTVTRFPHSLAVAAARIRLEAEGIPTFVEGERMGSPSMYRVATGGVKLQVPADLVDEARIILSQSWSLEIDDADLDDDFGDVDEDWAATAAEPGAVHLWVTEAILILVLASPLIIWVLGRFYGHR
jgi:hypothetical protein